MKHFIRQFLDLVKKIGLPVFALTVISGTFDQTLSQLLEDDLRNPNGASSKIWGLAALSLGNSLIFPWMIALLVLFALSQHRISWIQFPHFIGQVAEQSLIENLRAWGKTILYSFLFLIPGFWKHLEYSFTPWIVCFHPAYQRGEVDALRTSSKIFRRHWISLLLLLVLFLILCPLVLTAMFEEYRSIWLTPGPALLLHVVDSSFQLLYFQILSVYFFKALRENSLEPAFSMERN